MKKSMPVVSGKSPNYFTNILKVAYFEMHSISIYTEALA